VRKEKQELPTKLPQMAMAEVLEQLTQVAYARGASKGLRSAQWAALRYFHQTEDRARTVGRFAEYNMTTPSSASQTIETLVNRGFLRRTKVEGDQRSYRVDLTPSGRRLLAKDPLNVLVGALSALSTEDQRRFAEHLEKLFELVLSQAAARHPIKKGPNSP
jgi:DNA-binding MarR family transcriptional regulator